MSLRRPLVWSSSLAAHQSHSRLLQALTDFQDRIRKYEEVYETITDRNLHYIKLIDMCAAFHCSMESWILVSCSTVISQ